MAQTHFWTSQTILTRETTVTRRSLRKEIKTPHHRLDLSKRVIKQRFKFMKSQYEVVTHSLSRWSNWSSGARLTPGPPLSFFTLLAMRSLKTSRSLWHKIITFFNKRTDVMLRPLNSVVVASAISCPYKWSSHIWQQSEIISLI